MNNVLKISGERFEEDEVIKQAPREDVIIFENDGEIDIRAIKIMGISAKTSASAIGYFGTGLKYAAAVLMREGQEVIIYSGLNKFEFTKSRMDFRGKGFEVLEMNGEVLPFTTEFGKNWQVWQAYRELHCNCTDEGGRIYKAFAAPEPQAGKTIIIVKGQDILESYEQRATIILDRPARLHAAGVKVHEGAAHSIYCKGIAAANIKHSMNTYNLTDNTELTEDRTIKYLYQARRQIIEMIVTSDDRKLIESAICAPEGSFEADFNYCDSLENRATPSETFLNLVENSANKKNLNQSAQTFAKRYREETTEIKSFDLSDIQRKQLERAKAFSEKMGFPVTEYQIIVTDRLPNATLGRAFEGNIYLSARAFSMGVKVLIQTLIEEFLHLRHGFTDESRELQNFLFEKVVDLGAELHQEVL